MCAYIHIYVVLRRKGPVWHGRSMKTVLYIILGGRDPYCTGGVRRRCYDIHRIASLQMIENEWLCVIPMYVCVILQVCWGVIIYNGETTEYRFSWLK